MVELLVGVLVGLIATVVMFQVFAVSEGQKRTTTGVGDAQQNGLASLFQLERDSRMAGYGLNLPSLLGCVTKGYSEATSSVFTLTLAPVAIANGASATTPDSITILYGSSNTVASAERLSAAAATPDANYHIRNTFGFDVGDVFVVGEAGKQCTLAQVSSLPGTNELAHKSGPFVDKAGKAGTTRFNVNAGIASTPAYAAWVKATNLGARVLNLGRDPVFTTYSIENGALVATDATNAANKIVIADNIVQLQAQYGFDGNGDGAIGGATNVATVDEALGDQWADAVPATLTAQGWSRIVGVRMAVVARSVQPEKPDAAGNCTTTVTATMPRWYNRGTTIDVSGTGANWGCYRYRVFEVTVPIRNMAWFADETL
jgi:type IV pilus assembly protein PilW